MTAPEAQTILVTGATGYVGGRLIPRLLSSGYRVRCLVRNRDRVPDKSWRSDVEIVEGNVFDPPSLNRALKGVNTAYYLIHSLGNSRGNLVDTEQEAASNFAEAARICGVDRIIYLGGIKPTSEVISTHLDSRIKTGDALRSRGVSVTEFRAGVIVGSGSLSFELVRYLTERVPVLITPRWVRTRTQPIAIRDVLSYLLQALDIPASRDKIIEIGGADILTYAEMFARYATLRGLNRPIIKVPVLTPRLSSLWVGLVTPINTHIARQLIDGLDNEVVVHDDIATRLFDIEPISYETASERALKRFESDTVDTYWSGSVSSGVSDGKVFSSMAESENLIQERNVLTLPCSRENAFGVIRGLGGDTGWLYADILWRIRGLIDLLVGGIGMRKSRRSRSAIQPGDTIDFWRVEKVESPNYMLLRAEMKLPGFAWLEFKIRESSPGMTTITQTAYYEPRGLVGLMYWWVFAIPHQFIFPGMLRIIGRRAVAASRTESDHPAMVST
ncbi:MAG: SDR family oxidoreductase [Rhodothermales bacterium]